MVTGHQVGTEFALLDRTRHVEDAGYLSGNRKGCTKGTRRDVLGEIEQWFRDEGGKPIFWLNGRAGTGKSTIAKSFAEMCFADGGLGASFFCSRDTEEKSNLHSILPTLAFQLAHRFSGFREFLLPVLRDNPDVGTESLNSQMERLLVGPFQATQIRTLIIIDALDECQDDAPTSALLSVLSQHVARIPAVRFFITGRPDQGVRFAFRSESLKPHTQEFELHNADRSSVDSDIKHFLETQFTKLARDRDNCGFPPDGPAKHYIDFLCKKADGLFIYAATVAKFVSSRYHIPNDRLHLLYTQREDTSHEKQEGIDRLYTNVLKQAFRDAHSQDDKLYSRFKSVVGMVVLAFHPLSVNVLSELLKNSDTSTISISLQPLHSVIHAPDNMTDPVHIYHKSFPDFLTDKNRCIDNQFFIDPSIGHKEILLACLDVMKRGLERNICNLDEYAVLSEVRDLSERRTTNIGDTLEYACRFWTNHLAKVSDISDGVEEIYKAIDEFFNTDFLPWVEVLILTENLEISVYALYAVEKWYTLVSHTC